MRNEKAAAAAQRTVDRINASKDRYVVYKTSRPITDLKDMITSSAALYGDNIAFRQRFKKDEPYTSITYRQALADINALGTALIGLGLQGKRIALIGENCYQWAMSYLAVVCGVGVVVPLDKELGTDAVAQLCREAQVSAVIYTKKYAGMFAAIRASEATDIRTFINMNLEEDSAEELSHPSLVEKGRKLVASGDRRFIDAQIDPEEMQILLFTSGTTGIAKGVMLCHRNICHDLMISPTILNVNPWDIFFSVLPIHHTYECTCGFLMPLYKGASIAYCEGLRYIQKNLKEVEPTMFLAVPLIF